jgi:hypothetical protein
MPGYVGSRTGAEAGWKDNVGLWGAARGHGSVPGLFRVCVGGHMNSLGCTAWCDLWTEHQSHPNLGSYDRKQG